MATGERALRQSSSVPLQAEPLREAQALEGEVLLSLFSFPASLSAHHTDRITDLPRWQREGRERGNLQPMASCITRNLTHHQICLSIQLTLQPAALLNPVQCYLMSFLIASPPALRRFPMNVALVCVSEGTPKQLPRLLHSVSQGFVQVKRLLKLQSQADVTKYED